MGRPAVWTLLRCKQCGKGFVIKPHKARRGQRFCSVACRGAALPPPPRFGNKDKFRGDQVKRGAMHYRARQLTRGIVVCNRCGGTAELTHHIDENPANNALVNLERLCRRCHIEHHRPKLLLARKSA